MAATLIVPCEFPAIAQHVLSPGFRMPLPPAFIVTPPRLAIHRTRTVMSRSPPSGNPRSAKRMRQATLTFSGGLAPQPLLDPTRWPTAPPTIMRYESPGWAEAVAKAVKEANASDDDDENQHPAVPVASFDMDGTLIKTQSGAKFPKQPLDLMLWDPSVKKRLAELAESNTLVVIFSNQGGVSNGKMGGEQGMRTRIEAVHKMLEIPFSFYAATFKNMYRKPCTGMWELFKKNLAEGETPASVHMSKSFFVGDAAGRKNDFADSDFKFALNSGLDAQTPNAFFLGQPDDATMVQPFFMPKKYVTLGEFTVGEPPALNTIAEPADKVDKLFKQPCVVVMHGSPCSGKSRFINTHLAHLEQGPKSKSQPRIAAAVRQALEEGKGIVVEATNSEPRSRARYIALARDADVPVFCVAMDTPKDVVLHLNVVRNVLSDGKENRLADVVFNTFYKRFQKPEVKEGFEEVFFVKFKAHFENEREKDVFSRYS